MKKFDCEILKRTNKIFLWLNLFLLLLQFSCHLVLRNEAFITSYVRFMSSENMFNFYKFIASIIKVQPVSLIILSSINLLLMILIEVDNGLEKENKKIEKENKKSTLK